MKHSDIFANIDVLPAAGNPDKVRVSMEQWVDSANALDDDLRDFILSFTHKSGGSKLLQAIFGNSQYLTHCLMNEQALVKSIFEDGFDISFFNLIEKMKYDAVVIDNTVHVMAMLRLARRRVSLLVALADITENWGLEKVTVSLSEFAEEAVGIVVRHLLQQAARRGEIELADIDNPEIGSGLVVLAMGKLGAYELNYSSDIDLIVFFDPAKLNYTGRATISRFFIKFTQEMRRILDERTKDGYVFRCDLRLRPDPGSMPVAITVQAAELYYENLGQNWERAAMIKARPIAGDRETCAYVMNFIRPYVWRRSLDFYSLQDIHSIKRQINSKVGELPENLYGHNIKLGHGGIREIEFFAQTQQLIYGGRRPVLQVSSTCDALQALVGAGEVEQEICDELTAAYCFYRKLEHRLQMIADQQTHSLPENAERMQEFAVFMGYEKTQDFIDDLKRHITRVQQHYAHLFESSPSLASTSPEAGGSLVFTGSDDDPETLKTLQKMGFGNSARVSAAIRGWHHGRYRATRTTRAREILTELMPILLGAFSETSNPDLAFTKFDEFLGKLPSGVQIFSLFYSNPGLLNLIADIMGDYPYIAENLSRSPALLDYVLAPEFYDSLPDRKRLEHSLDEHIARNARDMQDVLDITRSWTHERQFRLGVQLIKRRITTEDALSGLSVIADIVLSRLLHEISQEFEEKYGIIEGSDFAIIALGKLGSQELYFGSDLDLIFIYDVPETSPASGGKIPLTAGDYFARLSRRFINAIMALTREGRLYDIDLRLRPSGNDGPVATSLNAFGNYYDGDAWVWEYMALTRARVVAGSNDFSRRVMATIRSKLTRKWQERELTDGVLYMHEKSMREHKTDNIFDIRYVRGGLLDLEYIAHYLQLKYAAEKPNILATNTRGAIENLRDTRLMEAGDANILLDALLLYSNLQSSIRLTNFKAGQGKIPIGLQDVLTEHTGFKNGHKDFINLQKTLSHTQKQVHQLFDKLVR